MPPERFPYTTHPTTLLLDARLRGHDGGGCMVRHSRESGNPAISRKRSLGQFVRSD
jgi:hypothetical protein